MPSRPTCSAWWVEGLVCSCGIMRVGKVTYARRAAWKGICTSCGMEPSDGARESDGRVYPMFAAAAGDESAYKRPRLPPSKPRAAKSRARPSTTTLLAAWGQEARAPSPPPAQPMQRTGVVQRQAIWRILFLLSARPSLPRWRVSTPMLRDRSRRCQPHGQRPLWYTSSHPRSHV